MGREKCLPKYWSSHHVFHLWHPILLSCCKKPKLEEYLSPCKEMQPNKWFVFRCWIPLALLGDIGREQSNWAGGMAVQGNLAFYCLEKSENSLEREPWLQYQCTIKIRAQLPSKETRPGWLLLSLVFKTSWCSKNCAILEWTQLIAPVLAFHIILIIDIHCNFWSLFITVFYHVTGIFRIFTADKDLWLS